MNLTEVNSNIACEVVHVNMEEQAKGRLLHLGIYPGAKLMVERCSKRKGPLTILVCGNFLMLRYHDCEKIEVKYR